MATQEELLRAQLGVSVVSVPDATLTDYLQTATALVDAYTAGVPALSVPPVGVMQRAYRLVGAELYHQDQAPNGFLNQEFTSGDGVESVPVRIGTDPLRPVRALLGMWVDPVTFA